MFVEYVIFLSASSGGGSPLAVCISASVNSSGSLSSLLILNDCGIGCANGVGALLPNGVKLKFREAIVSKPPPNIPLCASPVCCALCNACCARCCNCSCNSPSPKFVCCGN